MHGKTHTGFGTTAQFVRNVGIVIECCECNKWRKWNENSESDDVGNIFENVKVDKVDDKLICSIQWKLHIIQVVHLKTFAFSVESTRR
ncbi:hypothetical protein RhiirA5_405662 [Rhizophagus irregularis]|uniref:Uncharacterized protein n=1 Tax=Rhizophagus irregularis TaxID=588596 RepID=A0A2I1E1C2_9GLOM|nr:hypothetical protein RhiirA5_405662 [Rhizophagus irregularis]PKC70155.1 hypothetical protein RhiirA1_455165 [Rhizophagus irregularis]PKY15932.1 hypothetical protein RhiirB3_428220 [Rhizophagus irregularis]